MRSFTPSKRPLLRMAVVALIVLASGCLTIEENYTFKKNGSGTMEYVVDMSEMAEMMKGIPGVKDKGGPMAEVPDDKVNQLKALDGIKKVKRKYTDHGFVSKVSFAFADIHALNRALNVLMPDSTDAQQTFFRWEGNTLVRTNNRYAEAMGKDMTEGDTTDLTEVLKAMHYKYSFKFADGVKDVQLADGMAKESPDTKKLQLATDWSVIMKDPRALDLRIALDK